jgi:acetyl esterase/lipase
MPLTHFPAFVDDIALAIAHARQQLVLWGGDPARLFLMGHSAGAHLAALVAYDGRYLARQGLSPSILAGFIGLSGPYDFILDTPLLQATFAGTAEQEHDAQPVNFVTREAPRTLLAMGRDDTTVNPRNTTSLAAHLRAVGAAVEEVWVEGDHGVTVGGFARIYRDKSAVVQRVREFVQRR